MRLAHKEGEAENNTGEGSRDQTQHVRSLDFILCAKKVGGGDLLVSDSCNPMDYSLPGSSVQGILQAGILEWGTISFSRESSQPGIKPRTPALQADSLPSEL